MARGKSTAIGMPDSESVTVSVRKIDNGFIIGRSSSGPKGYECTETFSPTKPKLDIPAGAPVKTKASTRKSGRVARQGYR